MKITATKVLRELKKHYGYSSIKGVNELFAQGIIKDVIKIIDDKLKYHKGITIK